MYLCLLGWTESAVPLGLLFNYNCPFANCYFGVHVPIHTHFFRHAVWNSKKVETYSIRLWEATSLGQTVGDHLRPTFCGLKSITSDWSVSGFLPPSKSEAVLHVFSFYFPPLLPKTLILPSRLFVSCVPAWPPDLLMHHLVQYTNTPLATSSAPKGKTTFFAKKFANSDSVTH